MGVSEDAENGLAGGIPGYFEGKADALNAAVDAFGEQTIVVCPHAVYEGDDAAKVAKALSSPVARFLVDANRFVGNLGYRGEDLVTKLSLTPAAAVDDVAAVVAAAAAGDASIAVSDRVTRRYDAGADASREYAVRARFVDGTDAIRAAAPSL